MASKQKQQKHTMEITISPNGDTVGVHVQGMDGKKCVDASKFIEDGCGLVEDREYTAEYRKKDVNDVVNVGHVSN